jgi:succinate dehydrogenase / fumarate reductase flavoprotein subunit
MLDTAEVLHSDVVIIGGGMGGLVAAINARKHGVDVLVVDKGGIGWAGQVPISGGRSMVILPDESVDRWVAWAAENGGYLNNQDWAQTFGRNVYECTMELARWGMPVTTGEEGKLNVIPRMKAYKAVQFPAGKMMPKLAAHARKVGARLLSKVAVLDLITENGEVTGALGVGLTDEKFYVLKGKAFIVANGSCRYKRQKGFDMCNGEGVVMAFRNGAELMNAEFSNTYGFCAKDYEIFTRNPIYYFLVNTKGENVLLKHFPDMEESLRTKLERQDFSKIVESMAKEALAGNAPIYLDLTRSTQDEIDFAMGKHLDTPHAKWGSVISDFWNTLRRKGVDGINERIEIIPMFVGGQGPLRIDLECRTSVGRLWAVGDASALGCGWSGARSPGTYPTMGISFALVSGTIAGRSAAASVSAVSERSASNAEISQRKKKITAPLAREKGPTHQELFYRIHEAVVPIKHNFLRSPERIRGALAILEDAQEKVTRGVAKDVHQLVKLAEADGMATSGEITFRSALMRTETRGTHKREDFPERDDSAWLKWIIIQQSNGKMTFRTEPVPLSKYKFRPE